jgi:hypothetical protein
MECILFSLILSKKACKWFLFQAKPKMQNIKSPLSRGDLGVCAVVKYLQSVGWMKDRLEKSPL